MTSLVLIWISVLDLMTRQWWVIEPHLAYIDRTYATGDDVWITKHQKCINNDQMLSKHNIIWHDRNCTVAILPDLQYVAPNGTVKGSSLVLSQPISLVPWLKPQASKIYYGVIKFNLSECWVLVGNNIKCTEWDAPSHSTNPNQICLLNQHFILSDGMMYSWDNS